MKALQAVLLDLDQVAKEEKQTILKLFQDWDLDGSGTIEREELAEIMYRISPSMSLDEIAKLLDVVDTDGDGVISFDEFGDWLTNPLSQQVVGGDGWLADYQFEKLLRPLFNLWDRNSDGAISKAEFEECMQIMSNSLALCAGTKKRTDVFVRGVLSHWENADEDHDGHVTWDEFVQWQVFLMRAACVPNTILPRILEQMIESLSIILDIERLAAEGRDVEPMSGALQKAIETVAITAQRLYSSKRQKCIPREDRDFCTDAEARGVWAKPPPDCMTLLMRKCAIEMGVNVPAGHNLKSASWESEGRNRRPFSPTRTVTYRRSSYKRAKNALEGAKAATGHVELIVPEENIDGQCQRWFAKVSRSENQSMYFELKQDEEGSWGWTVLHEGQLYHKAVAAMRPEFRVYGLLQTCTLMDGSLVWADVERALKSAVEMGLMKAESVASFSHAMLLEVMRAIKDNPTDHPLNGATIEKVAHAFLEDLQLQPLDIMVRLETLDHFIVGDDVWEYLLEGQPKPLITEIA